MELNDEILCAYIDGELDPQMRSRVEEALASDGAARVRLERMRNADGSLRHAFPLSTLESNDALSDYIMRGPTAARDAQRFTLRHPAVWAALAAGITGILIGYLVPNAADRVESMSPTAFSSEVLSKTLETQSSGQTVKDATTSIEVQLTFSAEDGRYCRVFRVESDRESTEGIACRDRGHWKILALDATAARRGEFSTAGASELIDGAMDHLGGSGSLEPKQERMIIDHHWEVSAKARR